MAMRFGPQNASALSSLLAALQGGLEPGVGASQLSSIVAQQQAQRDARRQEMASITDQLLGLAQQGQPLGAAQSYLSSLGEAGVVRPQMADRARGVMNTAYGLPANPTYNVPGLGEKQGYLPLQQPPAGTLSPLAPPAPPMEPDYDLALASVLPEVSQLISTATSNGRSVAEIKQAILSDPNLALLYVKSPEVFDDLILQAATAGMQ